MPVYRDGIYVRAVGSLRTFQDKTSLSCFAVTPVEDFNAITHHFLEAIYVHCYHTKGPVGSASTQAIGAGTTAAQPWNQAPASGYLGTTATGAAPMGSMDYNMDSSFNAEQQVILDVLGKCTSDRGLKIDQIFTSVQGQMSEPQLRTALNYLTSEGHVYSTIDENHFKRTA